MDHAPHPPSDFPSYGDPNFPVVSGGLAAGQVNPLGLEHLSDEEVHKSQRNSKLAGLVVAVLVHVLILVVALIVVVARGREKPPEIVAISDGGPGDEEIKRATIQPTTRLPEPSAAKRMTQVLTANTTSNIAVPVIEDIITDDPVDFSVGIGDDIGLNPFGSGGGFALPAAMSSRCTQKDRASRLAESGGKPEAEVAVVKALRWLQQRQNEDGSFGTQFPVAMTGLALLAYLGHCETPDSEEFGETVLKAILYLVEFGMNNEGRLSNRGGNEWVYEHAIGTYALAEAYSITKYGKRKIPRIRQILEMSVPIIIQGQQAGGGWDYAYAKGGRVDLSVAGWQIQALKAAQYTKVPFEGINQALNKAMEFLMTMQGPNGGFGYTGPEDKITLAGVGALGLIMGTGDHNSRPVRRAAEFIVDNTKHDWFSADINLYGWYYSTQACFMRGGSAWTKWNRGFQDTLLKAQAPEGFWPQEGPRGGTMTYDAASSNPAGADADIYRTALCTLMLEVYYRYLPATETKAPILGDDLEFGDN